MSILSVNVHIVSECPYCQSDEEQALEHVTVATALEGGNDV